MIKPCPPHPSATPSRLAALLAASLLALAPSIDAAEATAEGHTVRLLLVPVQEAKLSSPVAARIERIPLQESESFHRGQILVEFDCAVPRAELQKARAELSAAEKTHVANTKLQALNSISQLEVAVSAANRDKARAELALNQARVAQCQIRAPFDGRLVERLAHPHETVAIAQPLLEILDDASLKTELIVPSRWVTWLKPGTPFSALIDETGQQYPAKVTAIGARVDPASQSLKVTGQIQGSHPELLAGMSGVAQFDTPPQRP